jgi:hypothetical protein
MSIIIFGVLKSPENGALGQENMEKEEIVRIKTLLAIGFSLTLAFSGLVRCTSGPGCSTYAASQEKAYGSTGTVK